MSLPHHETKSVNDVVRYVQDEILTQHRELLERVGWDQTRREELRRVVMSILLAHNIGVHRVTRETLADMVIDDMLGYGPIDPLLRDPVVTEVMVNGPDEVWVEENGLLRLTGMKFRDSQQVTDLISRIVAPLGRKVDQATPYVDARLPDGSRVHAIIPPLAVKGPVLTIRKFAVQRPTLDTLVAGGTLSTQMAGFLAHAVRAHLTILISGGTSTGKTTFLNALAGAITDGERTITIEESAELQLPARHLIALETRQPNLEGFGAITIRQLLRNALRMRPDRIVVGEVRGAEAFDLLQALNTGHEGSMSTIHANSAGDAISRLENMVLMAGEGLPLDAIRRQIASAVQLVVQLERDAQGTRRVVEVAAVTGMHPDGSVSWQTVFGYEGGSFRRYELSTPPTWWTLLGKEESH